MASDPMDEINKLFQYAVAALRAATTGLHALALLDPLPEVWCRRCDRLLCWACYKNEGHDEGACP